MSEFDNIRVLAGCVHPADTMDGGCYTVGINYGSITLAGNFELD